MSLVADFQALLDELQALKTYKAGQEHYTRSLERRADAAEDAVRALRDKVSRLEAEPSLLDPEDEEWIWRNVERIEFRERLGGGRSVVIAGRGGKRLARIHGKSDAALLGRAIEDASGRTRNRSADEAEA